MRTIHAIPQVDTEWLGERLHDWPDGSGPMYRRLAAALERLIVAGEVAGDIRLPAERTLAEGLRISRTTVAAAYELLADQRLVERRHGSGTYTRAVRNDVAPPRESLLMRSLERNEIFTGLIDPPRELVDMRAAVTHDAPPLPANVLQAAVQDLAEATRSHGYIPAGLPQLRAAVAARYTDQGLPTQPDEVLITGGAQQAIALVAMLHLRPGDHVITEALSHTGAIDLFTASGADIRTVPVSRTGADLDALERTLAQPGTPPRLVYLIPSIHNPLGGVMSAGSRRRLAALAGANPDVVVVADDTLADTYRDRRPPPPVASYPGGERILHTGSLSKLFWGGLRVGWVRGPVPEIRRLARLKALSDLGTSVPAQLLAIRVLAEGEQLADQRRALLAERGRALEVALRSRLPEWEFSPPEGGLCLWVRLPGGSAREVAMQAARRGLAVAPGSIQSPGGRFTDHLRLPYSHPEATLWRAADILAGVWRDLSHEPAPVGDLEDMRIVV